MIPLRYLLCTALLSLLAIDSALGISANVEDSTCSHFGFSVTISQAELKEGKYLAITPKGDGIDPLEGSFRPLVDDFSSDSLTSHQYYIFRHQLSPGSGNFTVKFSIEDQTALNVIRPSDTDSSAKDTVTVQFTCEEGEETTSTTSTRRSSKTRASRSSSTASTSSASSASSTASPGTKASSSSQSDSNLAVSSSVGGNQVGLMSIIAAAVSMGAMCCFL